LANPPKKTKPIRAMISPIHQCPRRLVEDEAHAELALGALRAEHRQPLINVKVGPPLVIGVLVRARR
jgi:hypothetical protein